MLASTRLENIFYVLCIRLGFEGPVPGLGLLKSLGLDEVEAKANFSINITHVIFEK